MLLGLVFNTLLLSFQVFVTGISILSTAFFITNGLLETVTGFGVPGFVTVTSTTPAALNPTVTV